MKIGEAEVWLRNELATHYETSEAANIAAIVMERVTNYSKTERLLKKDEPLIVQQLHHLTEIHHQLMQGQPMQYAIGEAHFYGLNLFVDKNVLIPRPETEELADWIIKDMKTAGVDVFERKNADADKTTSLKIIDVGTGSGCLALALKKTMPLAEVWACDVSEAALAVARRNGSELDIRVDFVELDFLDLKQRKQLPMANIIVSNPPYIPLQDKAGMQPHVVDHEPHQALFVSNEDPLVFYDALATFGKDHLHEEGCIYAEIHEDLGHDVVKLFEAAGYTIELKKDMQGKDRMVKVWPS